MPSGIDAGHPPARAGTPEQPAGIELRPRRHGRRSYGARSRPRPRPARPAAARQAGRPPSIQGILPNPATRWARSIVTAIEVEVGEPGIHRGIGMPREEARASAGRRRVSATRPSSDTPRPGERLRRAPPCRRTAARPADRRQIALRMLGEVGSAAGSATGRGRPPPAPARHRATAGCRRRPRPASAVARAARSQAPDQVVVRLAKIVGHVLVNRFAASVEKEVPIRASPMRCAKAPTNGNRHVCGNVRRSGRDCQESPTVRKNIALVDDDRNILTSVSMLLEAEGLPGARPTADGAEALEGLNQTAARPGDPRHQDAAHGRHGAAATASARRSTFPVIFLTSKDEEIDEVLGLRMGADDYITQAVLAAPAARAHPRRAAPRRAGARAEGETARPSASCAASWCSIRAATCAPGRARRSQLTVTEFLMLKSLAERPGHVKNRDQLMDAAYGETHLCRRPHDRQPHQAACARSSARSTASSSRSKRCMASDIDTATPPEGNRSFLPARSRGGAPQARRRGNATGRLGAGLVDPSVAGAPRHLPALTRREEDESRPRR